MRSMTGYGRGHAESELGSIAVEIQSVNRKHLEIVPQLDYALIPFDGELRRKVAEKVQRGLVTVRVHAHFPNLATARVEANVSLAKAYSEAWATLNEALEKPSVIDVKELANLNGVLTVESIPLPEEAVRKILMSALNQALEAFQASRRKEGKFLETDFLHRLQRMEEGAEKIGLQAPQVTMKYREKLLDRLKVLGLSSPEEDERILKEIALFAEKCDIAEELTRLRAHLEQAKGLAVADGPVGKTFEFLLQEILREMNTIGAKANDLTMTRTILEMKTASEQMREQIQNVE